MKFTLTLILFTCSIALTAQDNITYPDSLAIIKNHVKIARIYFIAQDEKRYQQKELTYDKSGRLVKESGDGTSFYYTYTYDAKGRRVVTTQRTKDGAFIQKFVEEYNDKDGSRRTSLFQEYDTTFATYIYTFDRYNRKIQEEYYDQKGLRSMYKVKFDSTGHVIASYDSLTSFRTANWRENGKLVRRNAYDENGKFTHGYRFRYSEFGSITEITDSTGPRGVQKYEIRYPHGKQVEYYRNGALMNEKEAKDFKQQWPELFPTYGDDQLERDNGLPVAPIVNEHKLTYDKKGNIIQDELIQKQGSYAQSYIYVYEYEFY